MPSSSLKVRDSSSRSGGRGGRAPLQSSAVDWLAFLRLGLSERLDPRAGGPRVDQPKPMDIKLMILSSLQARQTWSSPGPEMAQKEDCREADQLHHCGKCMRIQHRTDQARSFRYFLRTMRCSGHRLDFLQAGRRCSEPSCDLQLSWKHLL